MAIELEGEFPIKQSREQVFLYLNDPQRLSRALPDLQGLEVQDPGNYTVRMKVGIAHIRGLATIKVHRLEAQEPERAVFNLRGTLPGASVDLETGFNLSEEGNGCRVKWYGKAQIGGALVSMAQGLLKPIAKKNIDDFINQVRRGLEAEGS